MKTGNVFVRIAKLQLVQNVVPHAPRRAGRERRDRAIRKLLAQAAQLAVFRTKLMAPFRDTVSFVNRKEGCRHRLEPISVSPRASRSGER